VVAKSSLDNSRLTFLGRVPKASLLRRFYEMLRKAPVVGPPIHRLVNKFIPRGSRAWVPISSGLGSGLLVHLDVRFEMEYASGGYEILLQRQLSRYLRAGAVFYDVGAHIGIVSMFASELVGPNGHVFAFEADPENAKRIEEHAHRNALDQITVEPYAVASRAGWFRFERASKNSSRNQGVLVVDSSPTTENTVEVQTIPLDDFVTDHPVPDVIKIDVEGSEGDVLEGCSQLFDTADPVLICEVHHEQAMQEVTAWLARQQYAFSWLQESPHFPRHLVATRTR
jgi:FkbM family methyltransferase